MPAAKAKTATAAPRAKSPAAAAAPRAKSPAAAAGAKGKSHVVIAAPTGGNWEVCAKIAKAEAVAPALRKEALAQATKFLENPSALALLTGATPAKLTSLASRVANPPAGAAETSKLMAEILTLAEKARSFLEDLKEEEEGGAAKQAAPKKPAVAVKATKKAPLPTGGLKAAAAPKASKAKAGAKASSKGKALDVQKIVAELVKEAKADFAEDAVAALVDGVKSIAAPKKKAAAAPKKKAAAAPKKAKAAPKKKVSCLCCPLLLAAHPLRALLLTPTCPLPPPHSLARAGHCCQEEVKQPLG
jgi:hypothetical protein